MIVYDLECRTGQHRFEGWFKSSDDYTRQQERGYVSCPHCGSGEVGKAVQAPRLARKGNQLPEGQAGRPAPVPAPSSKMTAIAPAPVPEPPPQVVEMIQTLAKLQAAALESSRFVGDKFADNARAIHYGESEAESIHGQATVEEARELVDEGIAVLPLLLPVVPPEKAN
ncbi:DUF1178 family protein [Novosphingobium sp. FGD1]|jgi:hypothetical protein|uniref:DUF1178 family protein n=1 Tax=Novosphingobium silvae TaxID=2692619 RepID=A0A7X4K665_9SPHN|nr:DUF1178 family protein [Novosphingobium silvae]MYL96820.1 DUF1178 family protein [Novosphingobium silvae]